MPYLETYSAYVEFKNGNPPITWKGLRKGQAKWRYHWIRRNAVYGAQFANAKEFGWQREFVQ